MFTPSAARAATFNAHLQRLPPRLQSLPLPTQQDLQRERDNLLSKSETEDLEERRKVSRLQVRLPLSQCIFLLASDHLHCCIQGELVLHSSIQQFRRMQPAASFEDFLKQEWPADHEIYTGRIGAAPLMFMVVLKLLLLLPLLFLPRFPRFQG
jgi:hypothetical protein